MKKSLRQPIRLTEAALPLEPTRIVALEFPYVVIAVACGLINSYTWRSDLSILQSHLGRKRLLCYQMKIEISCSTSDNGVLMYVAKSPCPVCREHVEIPSVKHGSSRLSEAMDTNDSWRVGVLFSRTGPTAAAEAALLNGTLLAVEQVNGRGGVRGRPILPVAMDPMSDEQAHQRLARKMTEEEGISVIFGGYTSAGRKAIIPCIEKTNSLLFYPTFYEGFEYSDSVFYFGSCPNQYTVQLVDYMVRNFGNSFYLVGANYVFPRESNRIVQELLKQTGGRVVGQRYVALNSQPDDLRLIIKDIEKKKPDVVLSTLVGDQIVDFYKAYDKTKLRAAGIPIASVVTTETEIDAMGFEAAAGHYCAASYFETIDTPTNQRFVADYHARFGASCRANSCAESAYNQIMIFADALEKCGTMETNTLRTAVLESQFKAPQGDIRLDLQNHHTYLWSRIGVVAADGRVNVVVSSDRGLAPNPYLINYAFNDVSAKTGTQAASHAEMT